MILFVNVENDGKSEIEFCPKIGVFSTYGGGKNSGTKWAGKVEDRKKLESKVKDRPTRMERF